MTIGPDEDLLLAVLVQGANASTDPETAVSVTLTVGGLVVSGDLVPAWVWLREVRELLAGASGSGVDGMTAVFGMFADDALGDVLIRDATADFADLPVDDENRDEDDDDTAGSNGRADAGLPTALHLARARVLGAHHSQELAGGLWRGRLSHVSGWTFGRFEP
jgi:hypothetical protein